MMRTVAFAVVAALGLFVRSASSQTAGTSQVPRNLREALDANCASGVHETTVHEIVRVESGGRLYSVNVNGLRVSLRPSTAEQAAEVALRYISEGYSVDLGLMQINSRNLVALGMTVEQVLQPCANLQAGARILGAFYVSAVRIHGEGQDALKAALSAYNTGSFTRGFVNGYVARFYGANAAGAATAAVRPNAGAASVVRSPPQPILNPYTADTRAYAAADTQAVASTIVGSQPPVRVSPPPPPNPYTAETLAYSWRNDVAER